MLIEAVQAGIGFAVMPSCLLEERLQKGDLDALPFASGELKRTVHLGTSCVFSPTRATEQVAALIAQLMHEAVLQGKWRARWIGKECAATLQG